MPKIIICLSAYTIFLLRRCFPYEVRMKVPSLLSVLLLSLLPLLVVTMTDGCLADTRVALVMGNGAYRNVPRLTNPANDAADVAAALKVVGFETIVATDLDRVAMDEATIRFARRTKCGHCVVILQRPRPSVRRGQLSGPDRHTTDGCGGPATPSAP